MKVEDVSNDKRRAVKLHTRNHYTLLALWPEGDLTLGRYREEGEPRQASFTLTSEEVEELKKFLTPSG